MLGIKDAEALGKILPKGLTVEILTKAISSEKEETITVPDGEFFTSDEKETLLKSNYKNNKTTITEMLIKDFKKKTGVDFEGKDPHKFITEFESKILKDAKVEPNNKIEEQKGIIEKLKGNLDTRDQEYEALDNKYNSYKTENELLANIPENTVGLDKKTILLDMKSNGFSTKIEDGKTLVTKNGEVVRNDKTQEPISFKDVASQFLTEKKWLKVDKNGRDGNDEGGTGGTITNYQQFEEQCKKDGINPAGEEAQAKAAELAKDNPEFYN